MAIRVAGTSESRGDVGYPTVESGKYLVQVTGIEAKPKTRRDGAGTNIMIKLQVQNNITNTLEDDKIGMTLTDFIFIHDDETVTYRQYSVDLWANFLKACGVDPEDEIDEDVLIGTDLVVNVKKVTPKKTDREPDPSPRNEFKEFFPQERYTQKIAEPEY